MIRWKPSRDQAVDDGPRAAAGPEHDRRARGIFCLPTSLSSATVKPGTSVLWPTSRLPSLRDRVDRAGRVGLLGQPVDERHDPLLVRDRDVRAEEVVAAQLGDRVRQADRRPVPQLVRRVDALVVERGLLHRARQRVGDGMADEDDALRHARTLSRSSKKPG